MLLHDMQTLWPKQHCGRTRQMFQYDVHLCTWKDVSTRASPLQLPQSAEVIDRSTCCAAGIAYCCALRSCLSPESAHGHRGLQVRLEEKKTPRLASLSAREYRCGIAQGPVSAVRQKRGGVLHLVLAEVRSNVPLTP